MIMAASEICRPPWRKWEGGGHGRPPHRGLVIIRTKGGYMYITKGSVVSWYYVTPGKDTVEYWAPFESGFDWEDKRGVL
jgi:hypothetical protein